MDQLVEFMVSRPGRLLRISAGAALIAAGLGSRRKVLAAVGLISLLGGVLDIAPIALLFGPPMRGNILRRELGVLVDEPLLPPAAMIRLDGFAELRH
jgi:hypothetical protein